MMNYSSIFVITRDFGGVMFFQFETFDRIAGQFIDDLPQSSRAPDASPRVAPDNDRNNCRTADDHVEIVGLVVVEIWMFAAQIVFDFTSP